MGLKIDKTTAGRVKFQIDTSTPELYSNITNISIRTDVANDRIDIKWDGVLRSFLFADLESINGTPPPSDIDAAALELIETVFNIGGGDGGGVTLPINISDVTNLQNTLDGKVVKDGAKVLSDVNFSSAFSTKLNGIAAGATVNATDANLRDRTTHTGVQAATTITQTATARFTTDTEKATWNAKQNALPYALPAIIGSPGQVLAVNAAGDGLEWITPA